MTSNSDSRSSHKHSKLLLIIGCILLLFGFIFGSVGYAILKQNARFEKESVQADAVVLGKSISEKWNSKEKRNETSYYVRYEFTTQTGEKVESTYGIGSSEYNKIVQGQTYRIEYLPSEPQNSRTAGASDKIAGFIFGGIGSLVCLAGLICIISYIKSSGTTKRLLTSGATAEGTVSAVEPTSLSINRVTQWRVHYTYKDMRGMQHEGKTPHISPGEAQVWKVGDKGKVRFDKNAPHKNIWVG